MTKLMFAAALAALCATASARAQSNPPYRQPGQDTLHEALRDPDPIRRDERLIAGANRRNAGAEGGPTPRRLDHAPTFKAGIDVTNRAVRRIKSVDWTATLTNPHTGAVIRSYDVTTRARIAPGQTKRLTEKLHTPHASVVDASDPSRRNKPQVADLKVTVRSVTYEDGTTSATP